VDSSTSSEENNLNRKVFRELYDLGGPVRALFHLSVAA
jgi:hypothetical protein